MKQHADAVILFPFARTRIRKIKRKGRSSKRRRRPPNHWPTGSSDADRGLTCRVEGCTTSDRRYSTYASRDSMKKLALQASSFLGASRSHAAVSEWPTRKQCRSEEACDGYDRGRNLAPALSNLTQHTQTSVTAGRPPEDRLRNYLNKEQEAAANGLSSNSDAIRAHWYISSSIATSLRSAMAFLIICYRRVQYGRRQYHDSHDRTKHMAILVLPPFLIFHISHVLSGRSLYWNTGIVKIVYSRFAAGTHRRYHVISGSHKKLCCYLMVLVYNGQAALTFVLPSHSRFGLILCLYDCRLVLMAWFLLAYAAVSTRSKKQQSNNAAARTFVRRKRQKRRKRWKRYRTTLGPCSSHTCLILNGRQTCKPHCGQWRVLVAYFIVCPKEPPLLLLLRVAVLKFNGLNGHGCDWHKHNPKWWRPLERKRSRWKWKHVMHHQNICYIAFISCYQSLLPLEVGCLAAPFTWHSFNHRMVICRAQQQLLFEGIADNLLMQLVSSTPAESKRTEFATHRLGVCVPMGHDQASRQWHMKTGIYRGLLPKHYYNCFVADIMNLQPWTVTACQAARDDGSGHSGVPWRGGADPTQPTDGADGNDGRVEPHLHGPPVDDHVVNMPIGRLFPETLSAVADSTLQTSRASLHLPAENSISVPLCYMCRLMPRRIVIFPCTHLASCGECLPLERCPYPGCGQAVRSHLEIVT